MTVHDNGQQLEGNGTPTAKIGWFSLTIAIVLGLFYAYALWNAVAYLIRLAGNPLGLNAYGWFVLLFAVIFPVLCFAAAFALGRRRAPLVLGLTLIAGLGVVAVFWMNVVAYTTISFDAIVNLS